MEARRRMSPPLGPPTSRRPRMSRGGLPRWVRQVPYACVLVGLAAGLAVEATGHFKKGSLLVGAAVLFGALARLVLPAGQVGLLATRKRAIDVLILVGFAVAITVVAYAVQP
jgi:hypothetical protein